MTVIAVGNDASKGYADVCFRNEAGSVLWPSQRYDDTPAGHEALRRAFARLAEQHTDATFLIGIECTGGLERNWLQLFRSLDVQTRIYRLNPLAVKKFLESDLHRNVTDARSAEGIATYLQRGLRPADVPYEPEMEGPRTLCRYTLNTLDRSSQIRNELQSLLPSVQPGLVQYCRDGFPQWVLHVLVQCPTAAALSQADPERLLSIPYVKQGRVLKLIATAKESIASLNDDATGTVVSELASQALDLTQKVDKQKKHLWELLKHDPETKILKSIPGIGRWTAVILRLEVGPFARFHSDRAVVAFSGLDPRVRKSGDGELHIGISRRGKHQIRASLYMPILGAVTRNPVLKGFYARLREAGKSHLVAATACMAKLLRIAYACIVSDQLFDPQRHEEVQRRHEADRQTQAEPAQPGASQQSTPIVVGALDAPVSRREAKRRSAALAPTKGPRQKKAPLLVCG